MNHPMPDPIDPQLENRRGCLAGLRELFLLGKLYDWLLENFGFGRGCMGGCCGVIFFILFVSFACSIILGTDWFRFSF